jgi:putative ABC transport system permease protein
MSDVLYLAWRYLAYHRLKTVVLVTSITMIVYLPVGLNILVSQSAKRLTARADATPLLIGAKGSPLELVLNSLYFESDTPSPMRYAEVARAEEKGLARAIPLYTRFRAGPSPIVGTTLDYFKFRGLELAEGRNITMMGECVLGAKAAKAANVWVGGSILSSTDRVFDIAGPYPLKMRVVGILKPTSTPDDLAVLVDVKTTWVIEGLAHGHQDLSRPEAAPTVLRKEGGNIVGNAAVVEYNEITLENMDSFHFHGDTRTFPVTSVIAIPKDRKSSDLLRGGYLGEDEQVQIVEPADVMDDLLETIFTVRSYIMVAVMIVGITTLVTMALVFILSLQLRRREMETIRKIGGSRFRVGGVVAMEILGVIGAGFLLATGLSVLTGWFAPVVTRMLIMLS